MTPKYSTMAVPAYKVSKAALNMLAVQYAQLYTGEGFTFPAVSPGVSEIYNSSLSTAETLCLVASN
jgi:NAD(P)-dependent dehydrogenase (short-subunit alcohol dehydrogenase family)